MATDNTVILRVQLDEGKTEAQLQKLVLDMEATRKAQAALTLARKNDQVSTDEYAKQTVALTTQLKGQRTEYAAQAKNLELYRTATGDLANTYKGTQAQLSLAQNQYKLLEGSQNSSTESTKLLGSTIATLRAELTKTDETQGLFVRNVGNYPKGESLEPLIKQLVLLQEVQKQLPAGSMAAIEAEKQIGFQFGKVNEAAASAGLSQQQLNNKLNDLGERARPATTELAKLVIAQDAVAQSAGKDSEQYTKLGFQIGAARKEIAKVPEELAKVPTAADKASASVLNAFKSTGLYSQSIEKAQKFVGQFKTGLDVLKGGFKGVQAGEEAATEGSKVLKIGLAEIGIGLIIIAFTTLVSYFTQSAEGAKILAGVTSALGATFQVLTDLVSGTGRALALVFQGDFKGAGEQIAKQFDGVGNRIAAAAKNGYQMVAMEKDLIKARRELEVEDVKEQSRVAVLLRLSKERGKTATEQLGALKEAGEIEASITQKNIDLQQRELDLIDLKIKQKGAGSKGDLLQQQADAKKAIEQSLATQNEQNAKIQVRMSVFNEQLRQQGLADNKAYYDARAAQAVQGTQAEVEARVKVLLAERATQLGAIGLTENQKQAIIANSEKAIRELRVGFAYTTMQQVAQLEQLALDRRIQLVQTGSQQELDLQRQKLVVQRNLELAAANVTLGQRKIIEQKYQDDVLKLEADNRKQRILAAYDAEVASVNAELTLTKKGSQQETELRVEAINTQLAKELAALDKRKDNAAQEALLRANAAKSINDTQYTAAQANLERYLQGERNALDEAFALNKIREEDYNKAVLTSDVMASAARLQLAKTFTQDEAALDQQLTAAKIASIKSVGEKQRAEQAQHVAEAQQLAEGLTALLADTVATTGATLEDFSRKALILVIDSIEKTIIAAQIKILAEAFASPDSIATFGVAGLVKSAAIIAIVTAASETLKAKLQPAPKQFADGTVLGGASHAQGGVQLYSTLGYHYGEAEKDEIILTKGVFQNEHLRQAASALNVLGGGKPLAPRAHMALGGVTSTQVNTQLRGQMGEAIDYNQLASAMSRIKVKATISDVQAGLDRKAFTEKQSNS
ncbi:MAG: hypothetical protein ACRYFV_01630 [Janthinobacterium lividum]